MPLEVPRVQIRSLGLSEADFAARVAAFGQALDGHRYTVDVPAPTEHPLVEQAWRAGSYVIVDDNGPSAPPTEATLAGYVEAMADSIIHAELPTKRQTQMLARAHILQRNERRNGSLTAAEQAEEERLDAVWDWTQSVRDAEAAIQADIAAGAITTADAIRRDRRWPEPPA